MVARQKPLELGPFVPGVDNRRPEQKMKGGRTDAGDFLRFAVNADIGAEGTVKRRPGYTQALAATDGHSFWADGADAFMVDGQNLLRITGLPGAAVSSTLKTGLAPGRHVSYVRTPYSIYYSNGVEIGRLGASGVRPGCTPGLATPPIVTAGVGALTTGQYGLCFTQLDAAGEESAATNPIWITLGAGQGIMISGLPATFPSGVASVVVYLTAPNDSTLQRVAVLAAPSATMTIAVMPFLGARCQTVLRAPMPAGDIVRFHYGRLLVSSGNTLYYSDPYMLGLLNPQRGYMQFPGPITSVETTSGGVWVCADQTYWLAGLDIEAAKPDAKAPYGAVTGSGGQVPNSNDVFWMSPRGLIRAGQDGTFTNMQEAHVAVAPASFAAGFFREFDGRKQLGESTFGEGPQRMAAGSFMSAEIVRKEVNL